MTIFSKKLIKNLLEIADSNVLSKYAQALDLSSIMQDKLADFLDVIKPKKITTKDNKPLNITPNNIQNINDFLEFIRLNELKINGEPVVVRVSEVDKIPDENDRLLFSSRSPNFIKWDWSEAGPGPEYNIVSKSRLEKLIKELQDTQDNPLLSVYLNSYVDKLNAASGQQLGKPFATKDSGLMDGFDTNQLNSSVIIPQEDFDASNSRIKIKDVDLASNQSLENWLKSNNIKIIAKSNNFVDASNDLCGVVYLLNKRCDNLIKQKPDSISYKKYKSLLASLASSIGCDLNVWSKFDDSKLSKPQQATDKPSSSAPGTQQPSGKPGEEFPGQDSQSSRTRGGATKGDVIEEIFARAPLYRDMLSYEAIINFAEFVASKFETSSSIATKAREISSTAYQQMTGGAYFSTKTPDISFTSSYDNLFHSLMARGDQSIQQISNKISNIQKLAQDVFALLQSIYSKNAIVVENNQRIKDLYNTQGTRLANNNQFFNGALQNLKFRKK